MAWVRQYSAPNVGARKLKALIFYRANPLSYEKRLLWVLLPPSFLRGDLEAAYDVYFRLIKKRVVVPISDN